MTENQSNRFFSRIFSIRLFNTQFLPTFFSPFFHPLNDAHDVYAEKEKVYVKFNFRKRDAEIQLRKLRSYRIENKPENSGRKFEANAPKRR